MATSLLSPTPMGNSASKRNTVVYHRADCAQMPWLNQDIADQVPPVPPPKSLKRATSRNLSLRVLPYTNTEWKKLLVEVKREYIAKHYRACASRCIEILDNIKSSDSIQPAHLIYVRFYAATSLEMQVRGFSAHSPHRLQLLQQAREHYSIASDLAHAADLQMAQMKSFRPASPDSSLNSPVDSESSRASTSTRMSSPTPSIESFSEHKSSILPTKSKKRVAFCDTPSYEPYVRPDSPTLGMDDPASGRSSPCFVAPEESMQSTLPTPMVSSDEDFSPSESTYRYSTVLSSIQRQITSHLASIDKDIAIAEGPRNVAAPANAELRALELRSRIERLRANGWQRKRFDPEYYEQFREQVTADMMA